MKKVQIKTKQQFQEAFDKVLWHLIRMKKRSYDEDKQLCQYRAANKSKCAIGCLIPDELYNPKFDNGEGEYDVEKVLKTVFTGNFKYINKLENLQIIHDGLSNWHPDFGFNEFGMRDIVDFARENELKINENAIKSWVKKQEKLILDESQKFRISEILREMGEINQELYTESL